jgi:outer membrane murein-binding lipoprotein Lpp
MKCLTVVLAVVVLAVPFVAGCQENERKIERRETITTESQAQPIVVPDASEN